MTLPNLTIAGATPIAAWIPSLDTAGNGTTTLTDLTGNGHDGTLTNMDAATDWVLSDGKYALDFDGGNDYIALPNVMTGLSSWSMSLWVYSTSLAKDKSCIGDSLATFNCYPTIRYDSSSRYQFIVGNGSSFPILLSGPSAASSNAWEHLVLAYDGALFKVYRNGSETVSFSFSSLILPPPTAFRLGGGSSGSALPFRGMQDDVRLFNTALSPAQISALYNSGNGRGIVGSSAVVPSLSGGFNYMSGGFQ